MDLLKKTVLALLVAVWLPATSHCLLVALSGLESLACCSHEEPPLRTSHDNDCHTDTCASVESGLYKVEASQVLAPAPASVLMLFDCRALERQSTPGLAGRTAPNRPAELLPSVHFHTRAALPPRAPDRIA